MNVDQQPPLINQIESMRPWHHDIHLFDEISTGRVFSPTGKVARAENDGVSLISPRKPFLKQLDQLYPEGMSGKRFLDCACNAGGYCFWARERDIERGVGFDVRPRWIDQAKLCQTHRTAYPTDRLEFHVMDLCDAGNHSFGTFDMTYFSGIFYHLPDPIAGLKIAADMTSDILVINTAMLPNPQNPLGMTLESESVSNVMSGVHSLSWLPNSQETLQVILNWMGFKELKVTTFLPMKDSHRSRIEMIAAREIGRLANVDGESLKIN